MEEGNNNLIRRLKEMEAELKRNKAIYLSKYTEMVKEKRAIRIRMGEMEDEFKDKLALKDKERELLKKNFNGEIESFKLEIVFKEAELENLQIKLKKSKSEAESWMDMRLSPRNS